MATEFEKMEKAKIVLTKIAKGIDPLSGEQIKEEGFLNDPKIIRCFYFVAEVLDNVINGAYSNRGKDFIITPEQKSRVRFPEGMIGVNEFSRCINMCIDPLKSKNLTGTELNRRLKKMGVLGEELNPATGKMKTVTNSDSEKYGFEMVRRSFNDDEYDMAVMNDNGKKYLLDNIEEIMGIQVSGASQEVR